MRRLLIFLSLLWSLPACTQVSGLRFIDDYVIPYKFSYAGTTVGGLSGIDYDPVSQRYYVISDDRSARNPVRFYTVNIHFTAEKIDTVKFEGVQFLLQADGTPFPELESRKRVTPDPESIRFHTPSGSLYWSSEGDRNLDVTPPLTIQPAIFVHARDGKYTSSLQLPENLKITTTENGPRQNGVLEGLGFTPDFKTLWAALEEPRYEDGPRADLSPGANWIRLYAFDVTSQKCVRQYAYGLDPVAHPSLIPGTFKVNGVSEILVLDEQRLLVMERSFSTGRLACTVRIFLVDLREAEDVSANPSLAQKPPVRPAVKKLLLNTDDLGIYIDNVEGITFGPNLPNGHRSLVLVTDDNFLVHEKTQVLLFEVIP
ncbi:MAG: esterase-like activity of phytase family protein [Cyclobacteriaceae bacterium]|nr:esterase-like activity of phytase family protein [Cyclobacteriaceae bacterium]